MADSIFNNWGSVVAPARNEIVFELRNKNYGAYQLRRNYHRSIFIALFISSALFVLSFSLPAILGLLGNKQEMADLVLDDGNILPTLPPSVLIDVPLPEVKPIAEPAVEKIKFTTWVASEKDQTVEPIPIQNKDNGNIGAQSSSGTTPTSLTASGPEILADPNPEIHSLFELQEEPEFPGGAAAMNKWLMSNLHYPAFESDANITGTVHIEFIVDKTGEINDVKILKGVSGGPGLDKEALRVIKSMPHWKPGKMNGNPVFVRYRIPIKFSKG